MIVTYPAASQSSKSLPTTRRKCLNAVALRTPFVFDRYPTFDWVKIGVDQRAAAKIAHQAAVQRGDRDSVVDALGLAVRDPLNVARASRIRCSTSGAVGAAKGFAALGAARLGPGNARANPLNDHAALKLGK